MGLNICNSWTDSSFCQSHRDDSRCGTHLRSGHYIIAKLSIILYAWTSYWRVVCARCEGHIWLAIATPEVWYGRPPISCKLIGHLAAHIIVALNLHFLHTHGLKSLLLATTGSNCDPPMLEKESCWLSGIHYTSKSLLVGSASGQLIYVPFIVSMFLQLAHVALREMILDSIIFWNLVIFFFCKAIVPTWFARSS